VTPSILSAEPRHVGLRQGDALLAVIRPREKKIKGGNYKTKIQPETHKKINFSCFVYDVQVVATARPQAGLAVIFHLTNKAPKNQRRAVKRLPCFVYDVCVVAGSDPAGLILRIGLNI